MFKPKYQLQVNCQVKEMKGNISGFNWVIYASIYCNSMVFVSIVDYNITCKSLNISFLSGLACLQSYTGVFTN